MSSEEIVIDARNLRKRYEIYAAPRDRLKQLVLPRIHQSVHRAVAAFGGEKSSAPPQYYREFWALNDVSFQVRRGETLGIIGRNGSGKSTLLQILAGTLAPTSGDVRVVGRIAALLELGSGFNPEFTGRENVYLNGRILGLTHKEIDARYEEIVAFADIGDFVEQPVKTYSSGMFVRLAFAVQAHIDASIVIIDEALAVGDVFFTQKCYGRLRKLVESGAAVVLVSHDMSTVTQFCSDVLVLDKGSQIFRGEPVAAIRRFMSLSRDGIPTREARSLAKTQQTFKNGEALTEAQFPWPLPDAFLDIDGADVVHNGQAEFIGVAVCATNGEPARLFEMGESAYFYFEFRVLDEIDVPIGGVTLVNEKNILVHGKNSMQYKVSAPPFVRSGATLRFRQRVVLDIAPGEYTFVVGLATVDLMTYENADCMSNADIAQRTQRVVSVGCAGTITVTMRREGLALTHHGLANLPGESALQTLNNDVVSAQ